MKNKLLLIAILLVAFISCGFSQTYFGKARGGDWETLTLLTGAKADTAYSNPIQAQFPISTLKLYLNVTAASTSDSLWVYLYESADNVTYKQITSTGFTTSTATNTQVVTLTNCPKYLKAQYYVMGAASSFTFTLKAVARP